MMVRTGRLTRRLVVVGVGLALAGEASARAVSDDQIFDTVSSRLATNPVVKGGDLTVDCQNGVVILSGSVETERQVNRAVAVARGVRGVKEVVNHIVARTH